MVRINDLPKEVMETVFSYLDFNDVYNKLKLVDRYFNYCVNYHFNVYYMKLMNNIDLRYHLFTIYDQMKKNKCICCIIGGNHNHKHDQSCEICNNNEYVCDCHLKYCDDCGSPFCKKISCDCEYCFDGKYKYSGRICGIKCNKCNEFICNDCETDHNNPNSEFYCKYANNE